LRAVPQEGQFAFVTPCREFHYSLWSTREEAEAKKAFVDKMNRPQSYVSKYESGERRLDVIEFLRVAKVLRVAVEDILNELT
jgi:hypothetical protein